MATQRLLGKYIDIIMGIAPLDLQTQRNGDYISLKNYEGVGILVVKGVGTDNDDPTFTVQQAQDVAGTGVKDLDGFDLIYKKEAVDMTTLGVWTKVTQTADEDFAPGDPSAQSQALYFAEIDARILDVANGFDCLRVNCSDVGGNAQLGCVVYLPFGLRFQSAPENLQSGIVD